MERLDVEQLTRRLAYESGSEEETAHEALSALRDANASAIAGLPGLLWAAERMLDCGHSYCHPREKCSEATDFLREAVQACKGEKP